MVISSLGLLLGKLFLKKEEKPNTILITIDSLRPDHLGCYGYGRNTSPNIDRLAKEGVRFNQAISQVPMTPPSVLSFFTSTYPCLARGKYYLDPTIYSPRKILKDNGYTTGLFSNYFYPFNIRIEGIKDNFDTCLITGDAHKPLEITRSAIQWLKKNKNKKFFLWLYYFGPHASSGYGPRSPYGDIFLKDNLLKTNRQIPIATNEGEIFGVIPKFVVEDNIQDVDYYIAKYDGQIRVVDNAIGLLLEELRKLNLDTKTLIVLNADHAEGLGERNLYFSHVYTLYDEAIKIPLILRYPGVIPGNRAVDYQGSLLDIMPTVTDILDLDIDKEQIKNIEGISLKNLALEKEPYIQRYAFSITFGSWCIRTENWKLIYRDFKEIKRISSLLPNYRQLGDYYTDEYELYNLKNDPRETQNLINEEKKMFISLKQKLDEFIIKTRQKRERQRRYRDSEVAIPLDEETKEKIKSLGYIQ